MIVVSNTSPITNLSKINSLSLLHQIYDKIFIPPAVYYEITTHNSPGSKEVQSFDWIEYKNVSDKHFSISLEKYLDRGESEAIALAVELNADLIILDENKGRQTAKEFDLNIIGTLGILLKAKSMNLIDKVKPYMDDLLSQAGFWIDSKTYDLLINLAKEKE